MPVKGIAIYRAASKALNQQKFGIRTETANGLDPSMDRIRKSFLQYFKFRTFESEVSFGGKDGN